MKIELFGKDGKTPINGIEDWEKYGEPAEKKHWKKGRSAYEIAKSWLPNNKPGVPDGLVKILSNNFGENISIEKAIVEKKTYFSDTSSGPRNHDLLLYAKIDDKSVIIGIEGKERESYDKTLINKFNEATSPNSKLPNRINYFCQSILNDQYHEAFKDLRYQFLSGVAGVSKEVEENNADYGLFIVQQIKTQNTPQTAISQNEIDFNHFMKLLDKPNSLEFAGENNSGIWGPLNLIESQIVPSTKMYIGKFYHQSLLT